ncbi:MAG: sensor histidine kinase KdpD [Actinomycetales bacterium]|nr:sensor histidine kinase KdpD [Actinomycetales bacterium]
MRGRLRIYLGAAPGVGKTYAMLDEGARRLGRGSDVVVGFVETHDRVQTAARLEGLTVLARRRVVYRDQVFEEMDLPAILARHPSVALVDELAHTNVPGVEHVKRWEDVEELLEAGIDVISTVNLQHLESVNDVVEAITGIAQRETVPDRVVRAAEQVQLVDQTPEALRRRLAHGNIYPAERVDAALSNFFRPGNLAALRELALLWLADRVDDEIQSYRERHGIVRTWETRERIVVAIAGDTSAERVIRRGARMAARSHAELVGVHVTRGDGLSTTHAGLDAALGLLEELGGRYVEVVGTDVAASLVAVARSENATQLLLAASPKSRLATFLHGSVVAHCVALTRGEIDLHVIGAAEAENPEPRARNRRRWSNPVGRRRELAAAAIGAAGFVALTLALGGGGSRNLPLAISAHLLVVLAVAGVGSVLEGLAAAIVGFALINWEYTPPVHTFSVADARDVAALVAYLAAALSVSGLVDLATRRTRAARRAERNARALARLARSVAGGQEGMRDLVTQVVRVFELRGASLRATTSPNGDVTVGVIEPDDPVVPLGEGYELRVGGRMDPAERELLVGVAAQLVLALERRRLQAEANERDALAEGDALRASLLAAVSHDLRTPLASIKTATTTLISARDRLEDGEVAELLEGIDAESDRLNGLVGDLLDMNRIHEGTVEITSQPVDLVEIAERAIAEARRAVATPEDVSRHGAPSMPVTTDPVLVERIVANLVRNALEHGGAPVSVDLDRAGGGVVLRVIDHGPGIDRDQRSHVFEPFQRRGDITRGRGVGLGLAIARGFATTVGAVLDIEDTPGGGCTMVLSLPEKS